MRALLLTSGVLVLSMAEAHAACPAAPTGSTSDAVLQMMWNGSAPGLGLVNNVDATKEGAFVYDSTNDLLKYCDGTNWISLTTGSETDPQVANVNAGNACIGTGSAVDCGNANVGTKDDITTRTASGFWQTATATTAEGWPVTTNGWYHLLTSTHSNTSNYYSMQFAGHFSNSNDIYYRSTAGSGATAWNKIWHAGNDGSGSGLDADTLDAFDSAQFLRSDADDTTTGNLTSNKQFIGGFGAMTTGGVLDWNDSTNARSGNGYTILSGAASNGPGGSFYFHPFSFEYSSKTGAGNMTQFAIPYSQNGVSYRTRVSGTWNGWNKMWDSSNDGAGSGLDADTLDGLSSASFLHTYAESSQITPTTASTMSFSHGLGARPEKFGVFLEAASATYGFAVGDRVAAVSGDGDGARQVVVWANATTVNFKAPSNMIVRCPDGSNRYITDGSGVFKVVLWAEKRP